MIGEHGDSEFPLFSSANIANMPLKQFLELKGVKDELQLFNDITYKVRNSAYDIIDKKHATYYGIASAVKRIAEAIVKDEHSILPLSVLYDENVYMSLPAIISSSGIEQVINVTKNQYEQSLFQESYLLLKNTINELYNEELL